MITAKIHLETWRIELPWFIYTVSIWCTVRNNISTWELGLFSQQYKQIKDFCDVVFRVRQTWSDFHSKINAANKMYMIIAVIKCLTEIPYNQFQQTTFAKATVLLRIRRCWSLYTIRQTQIDVLSLTDGSDKLVQKHAWVGEECNGCRISQIRLRGPGYWINIQMPSYQHRKSHSGDKTILRTSYLHNGFPYTGKMTSLYCIGAQVMDDG